MLPIDCFRGGEGQRLAAPLCPHVREYRVTEISHGNYILKCCFAELYLRKRGGGVA